MNSLHEIQYLVNLDDYEIDKEINRGGFGIIYLVKKKATGELFAAKINFNAGTNESDFKLMISREMSILICTHHPTIIHLRGYSKFDFSKNKNLTILMDYMPKGSLYDLLYKDHSLTKNSNTIRQIILTGIARGMMYLHEHFIIHRDLKSANVLLDQNYHPYISDFGLSKMFDPKESKQQSKSNIGTIPYMAPEVISFDYFNTKADVYAYAIIMYEVLTGQPPYPEYLEGKMNAYTILNRVLNGNRPKIPDNISKQYQHLIERCWAEDPDSRPTFREIYISLSSRNHESDDSSLLLPDVNIDEFRTYLEIIDKDGLEPTSQSNGSIPEQILLQMKQQQQEIDDLRTQLTKSQSEINSLHLQMNKIEESHKTAINQIHSVYQSFFGKSLKIEMGNDPKKPSQGLLDYLRTQNPDYIVPYLSSNDPYNLIDPDSNDVFASSNTGMFFIEFQFKTPIDIAAVELVSQYQFFPKSFDVLVNDTVVASIKEAVQLNKANSSMLIEFEQRSCRTIQIKQTGDNWDQKQDDTNYPNRVFGLKKVDLKTRNNESVFRRLLNQYKNPHHCGVHISWQYSSFDSFMKLDNFYVIINKACYNNWFQISLTKGAAIIKGFRLKRTKTDMLKNYKIIVSDDDKRPTREWFLLFEILESDQNEHKVFDIYETKLSPPIRNIRIVNEGLNWSGNNTLIFSHFDVFGYYVSDCSF